MTSIAVKTARSRCTLFIYVLNYSARGPRPFESILIELLVLLQPTHIAELTAVLEVLRALLLHFGFLLGQFHRFFRLFGAVRILLDALFDLLHVPFRVLAVEFGGLVVEGGHRVGVG